MFCRELPVSRGFFQEPARTSKNSREPGIFPYVLGPASLGNGRVNRVLAGSCGRCAHVLDQNSPICQQIWNQDVQVLRVPAGITIKTQSKIQQCTAVHGGTRRIWRELASSRGSLQERARTCKNARGGECRHLWEYEFRYFVQDIPS